MSYQQSMVAFAVAIGSLLITGMAWAVILEDGNQHESAAQVLGNDSREKHVQIRSDMRALCKAL